MATVLSPEVREASFAALSNEAPAINDDSLVHIAGRLQAHNVLAVCRERK
jgi:uncharacterized protein (DUF2336 family)